MIYDINDTYKALVEAIVYANEVSATYKGTPRGDAANNLIIAAENAQDMLDALDTAQSYASVA